MNQSIESYSFPILPVIRITITLLSVLILICYTTLPIYAQNSAEEYFNRGVEKLASGDFQGAKLIELLELEQKEIAAVEEETSLITSLSEFKEAVLDKIDSDIETTSRSFWDAYNIEKSRRIADYVLAPLTIIEETLGVLSAWTSISEIKSRLDQAGSVLEIMSIFMGVSQLQEAGQKLQLAIDGPTYSSLVQTMLDDAARSSVPGEYATTIKHYLYGISGRKSPVGVPHWLVATAQPKAEIMWGAREVKREISDEIAKLINELKSAELGPTVPVNTIQKRLNVITTGIKKSKADNVTISYSIAKPPRELEPTSIDLGTIGALEQVRVFALTNYDKDMKLEQISVVSSAVKAGSNALSLSVGYKTPEGKMIKKVNQFVVTPITTLTSYLSRTYSTNARQQVNGIPQEMVLTLPSELSNTLRLVDDVVGYVRSFTKLPEVAAVQPEEQPEETIEPASDEESSALFSVVQNGKWGYIDKTGNIIIKPQFDRASAFSEGLAGVKIGNKHGFIDQNGIIVIEPKFDKAWHFSEGLAIVKIGKIGIKCLIFLFIHISKIQELRVLIQENTYC